MNVLIVDDSEISRKLLRALLEGEHHEVTEAGDGLEALATLAAGPVDAIMSDILMPRMDGYRLCSEVRASERLQTIPFIFYTSTYTSPRDEKFARALGADRFLRKPASARDILRALYDAVAADRQQTSTMKITDPRLLQEYSDRLITKLEQRNADLANVNDRLKHEVAERTRAEAALGESERRFRDMMENVQLVTLILGDRAQVLFCNEYLLRLTGWQRNEVLGRDYFEIFIPPEARGQLKLDYDSLMHGEHVGHAINEIITRGGERRLISWNNTSLKDAAGRVVGVASIAEDITERRQAEAALRESEAKFRQLSESLPQLIWTCRADGQCDYLSPQWVEYTGISDLEQLGLRWLEQVHPDDRDHTMAGWKAMVDSEKAVDVELRIRRKDGVYRWFRTLGVPLRDDRERVVKWFGTNTDVDDQRQADEQRRVLEAQLRQAQKMEALGTLAGGIAHDFNNILGAIIGNTELARQDVGPDHLATESLTEIDKASHRAKDLVQRILAFGRQQQQPQTVIPLRPIIEEAVALLRATLPAGVELTTFFDAETPHVRADDTQIHQLLMNLCTNAWHAMSGKSGRIDIRLDAITLDAEGTKAHVNLWPGSFARICVTDNGSGMEAATLEHIFDPFFSTKPVDQGTGLGLSVVHGIVDTHGGILTVQSQFGTGTTFSIYFPAAETLQPGAGQDGMPSERFPAGSGQHVLYLDDEEPLVAMVSRLLKRLKYRVSGFTRPEDALAAVRADPGLFDLVITDLNMPVISGLEVADELSRLRPSLPVVMVSGYITEDLRVAAVRAGVRQLIYKPNTVDELAGIVHQLAGSPNAP